MIEVYFEEEITSDGQRPILDTNNIELLLHSSLFLQ